MERYIEHLRLRSECVHQLAQSLFTAKNQFAKLRFCRVSIKFVSVSDNFGSPTGQTKIPVILHEIRIIERILGLQLASPRSHHAAVFARIPRLLSSPLTCCYTFIGAFSPVVEVSWEAATRIVSVDPAARAGPLAVPLGFNIPPKSFSHLRIRFFSMPRLLPCSLWSPVSGSPLFLNFQLCNVLS